jgi:hypothetical protein
VLFLCTLVLYGDLARSVEVQIRQVYPCVYLIKHDVKKCERLAV